MVDWVPIPHTSWLKSKRNLLPQRKERSEVENIIAVILQLGVSVTDTFHRFLNYKRSL